jgi:filamentous hemagglutinin family protein
MVAVLPALAGAQIALDGSLGRRGRVDPTGGDFRIRAEWGQQRGGNLFHSFRRFGVPTGTSATFLPPDVPGDAIANVLARVTGGSASSIDGLLRSAIPGAHVFLLNPAGILFGPNARLDVGGSFHASTADSLRLADGAQFHASLARPSTLAMAPPAAFGFLAAPPAAISMESGAVLSVPDGQALSLIGGDVRLRSGSVLAPGGRVNLASAAAAGEVVIRRPGGAPALDASTFSRLGPVTLNGTMVVASSDALGGPSGTVVVRAGRLALTGDAAILVENTGAADGASLGVDIDVRGAVRLDGPLTGILAGAAGSGSSGGIRVEAGSLAISGGALITTLTAGNQAAGDIEVLARESVEVVGGPGNVPGGLTTSTFGAAPSGAIRVRAGSLILAGGAQVVSETSGAGRAGDIDVEARDAVVVTGVNADRILGGLFSESFGEGRAGATRITAPSVTVTDRARVSAASFGTGPAGRVDLDVARLVVSGGADVVTNASGGGAGGPLRVRATESVSIVEAVVSSASFGTGDSGPLEIRVPHGTLNAESSFIDSGSGLGASRGGPLTIEAGDVTLARGTRLFASAFEGGRAGDVHVTASRLAMSEGSTIESDARGSGRGGEIRLTLGEASLTGGSLVTSGAFASGAGGNISVEVEGTLSLLGRRPGTPPFPSGLFTNSQAGSTGAPGSIAVDAGQIVIRDGAGIDSSTQGAGHAGTITVTTGQLVIDGAGNREITGIASGATFGSSGRGGRLHVTADEITLIDRGLIATTTFSSGPAGSIEIVTGTLRVIDAGIISSSSFSTGAAGSISITARGDVTLSGAELRPVVLPFSVPPVTVLTNSGIDSTAFGTGPGGSVTVTAGGTFSASGPQAGLFTRAGGDEVTDRGGDIRLSAREVRLADGAMISAQSTGLGNAGNIGIEAGLFTADSARVTTTARSADGGNIDLTVDRGVHLVNSTIQARVGQGQGGGGNVAIDPDFVVLNGSTIRADAFGGPGGRIRIVAGVFLASPDSVLDASSALGVAGTVDISSPVTDVAGAVAPLSQELRAATPLLREACATRAVGQRASRFVTGPPGVPADPASWLAELPVEGGFVAAAAAGQVAGLRRGFGAPPADCAR